MAHTDHPQASLANWRQHPFSTWGFTHVDRLVPVAFIQSHGGAPLPRGEAFDLDSTMVEHAGRRLSAAAILDETYTDAFLLMKQGKVVAERYPAQQADDRHIVFSISKSITAMLAGILAEKGLLDTEALVPRYVPEAKGSAYADATARQVLDMTVSVRFTEDYLDPLGDVARYRVAMGWNPPGLVTGEEGLHGFIASLPKGDHPHGERFHYVSPNSDMLGWIIERASGSSIAALLSRHLWQPLGMAQDGFITVDRQGAARTAGGICMSLEDLARIGEAMRNFGACEGRQILPRRWVEDVLNGGDAAAWAKGDLVQLFPEGRYRSQWYVADPSSAVLCAIGIHGQWVYVDYEAGVVAVKQSSQPIPADDAMDHQTLALFRALVRDLS